MTVNTFRRIALGMKEAIEGSHMGHPDFRFAPENGAWGRQGCTGVLLAAVDEETAGEALTLAWQNSAAKAKAKSKAKRPVRHVKR